MTHEPRFFKSYSGSGYTSFSTSSTNILSISLPKGQWDVSANLVFRLNLPGAEPSIQAQIKRGAAVVRWVNKQIQNTGLSGYDWQTISIYNRVTLTATTTMYLSAMVQDFAVYSAVSDNARSYIRAKRVIE